MASKDPFTLLPVCDGYEGLECCSVNLVNGFGMEGNACKRSRNGFTMWLKRNVKDRQDMVFKLDGIFPLGKMHVWNYNRIDDDGVDYTVCGMREIRVYHSIDGRHWKELVSGGYPYVLAKADGKEAMPSTDLVNGGVIDFGGITAQYIRLAYNALPGLGNYDAGNRFADSVGLAKIKLYPARGLAVRENKSWTELFAVRDGWAGADGIYSVALNGVDNVENRTKTLMMFGDTLIGSVKPGGDQRSDDTVMINNSCCILENGTPSPGQARFRYNTDAGGVPQSLVAPDAGELNLPEGKYFFWLQDALVHHDMYYSFPLIMHEETEGVEGYMFGIDGVAFLSAPIAGGDVCFDRLRQGRFPLMHTDKNGNMLIFGCAVFVNTKQAMAPQPDGYIYIYGYKPDGIQKNLYVSRVREADFSDLSAAEFFTGRDWSARIEESACICENISCEMSVSPYFGEIHKGKYILVFQEYVNSPIVSCRIAETPAGPFGDITQLYHCRESELGNSIYTYNAKAHPHLSEKGRLLVSYNVNACSMEANQSHAMIYSPRFIELYECME